MRRQRNVARGSSCFWVRSSRFDETACRLRVHIFVSAALPMRHVVLEVLSQTRRAVLPFLFLGAIGVVAAGLLAQQGALLQSFGASTADGSRTVTAAASGGRPLRLLLVGHELSLTGAPQIQLELAIELRQRGHNVRWDTAFLAGANICLGPSMPDGAKAGTPRRAILRARGGGRPCWKCRGAAVFFPLSHSLLFRDGGPLDNQVKQAGFSYEVLGRPRNL